MCNANIVKQVNKIVVMYGLVYCVMLNCVLDSSQVKNLNKLVLSNFTNHFPVGCSHFLTNLFAYRQYSLSLFVHSKTNNYSNFACADIYVQNADAFRPVERQYYRFVVLLRIQWRYVCWPSLYIQEVSRGGVMPDTSLSEVFSQPIRFYFLHYVLVL